MRITALRVVCMYNRRTASYIRTYFFHTSRGEIAIRRTQYLYYLLPLGTYYVYASYDERPVNALVASENAAERVQRNFPANYLYWYIIRVVDCSQGSLHRKGRARTLETVTSPSSFGDSKNVSMCVTPNKTASTRQCESINGRVIKIF